MGDQPCKVIPNPLDTGAFAPVDQAEARSMLGLPEDRKLLLFGALDATSDPRKGYDLLVDAIMAFERNHNSANIEVMVFGAQKGREIPGVS